MKNRTIIFAASVLMALICTQVDQAKPVAANLNTINVQVTPHGTYAEISVVLAVGAPALLQISDSAAMVTSGHHPKSENITYFKKGATVAFTRVLTERNQAGGFATHQQVNTLLPNGDGALKPNIFYSYVVQVIEKDGSKTIQTGMFKTKFRAVDIYITEIHVLNDSDKSGDGEISFNFFLDNKHVKKLPTDQTTYSLNDNGEPLKFGNDFVIHRKPTNDSTMLTVEGWDDDTSSFTLSNCGTSGVIKVPDDQNGKDSCGQWTLASRKINFTSPNATGSKENFDKSYVLHGLGGNGSDLEFEVYVTVKVFYK